jgi:DNA-binding PadR family transcriptional regulator
VTPHRDVVTIAAVLDLALLGLLKERPMHGYDLCKRLREDFGTLTSISFGSLYPALARLEAAGAVRAIADEPSQAEEREPPIPATGSLSGERAAFRARLTAAAGRSTERAADTGRRTRARKIYEITSRGEALFERLLEEDDGRAEDARGFSVRLAFARHLTPGARLRLLERRRSLLLERLSKARRSMASSSRPLDPYERSLAEHTSETTALDISWLERLIDAERGNPAAPALVGRTDS